MKKSLYLFSFLSLITISSCGSNTENEINNIDNINKTNETVELIKTVSNFSKIYEGTIDNKYEIILSIENKNGKLSGNYRYKNNKNSLKITGTVDKEGNITLNEFNESGSMTGVFNGVMTLNNISGEWRKPDGTKIMPFNIIETKIEYSLKESTQSNLSDWSGIYTDKFGATLKITGPNSEGAIDFAIEVQYTEKCEGGGVEGKAYLTKENVAIYSEDGGECSLNFIFNIHPSQIQIGEFGCESTRGAACGSYEGFYLKKNE